MSSICSIKMTIINLIKMIAFVKRPTARIKLYETMCVFCDQTIKHLQKTFSMNGKRSSNSTLRSTIHMADGRSVFRTQYFNKPYQYFINSQCTVYVDEYLMPYFDKVVQSIYIHMMCVFQ